MSDRIYVFCVQGEDMVQPEKPVWLYNGPRDEFGHTQCVGAIRYLLRCDYCSAYDRYMDLEISPSDDIDERVNNDIAPTYLNFLDHMHCGHYTLYVVGEHRLFDFMIETARAIEDCRMELLPSPDHSDSSDSDDERE